MLKHVNNDNFENEVVKSEKVTLVDFFATWCGPCQMLSQVLEKMSTSRAQIDIAKVDVDESVELAQKYEIDVVPTMIIFKDGKIMKRIEGFHTESELMDIIESIN